MPRSKSHPELCTLKFTVRDAEGRVTSEKTWPSRSFLVAYYNILYVFMSGNVLNGTNTNNAVTDIGGASRTIIHASPAVSQIMAALAEATNVNYGILVGTGTTANSGTTSALATAIANGNGGGQLQFGNMSVIAPSGSAPLTMVFSRTLVNNSVGNIVIKEAGIGVAAVDTGAVTRYFLILRDVNAGGFATVNSGGGSATATYTMSYTIA